MTAASMRRVNHEIFFYRLVLVTLPSLIAQFMIGSKARRELFEIAFLQPHHSASGDTQINLGPSFDNSLDRFVFNTTYEGHHFHLSSSSTSRVLPFPRWGPITAEDGDDPSHHLIRIETLVDFVRGALRGEATLFPGGEEKYFYTFPETFYVIDRAAAWSSERIRSRTTTLFLRSRGLYMEQLMIWAQRKVLRGPKKAIRLRWPNVLRVLKQGCGFPFLAWYGDFRGCNYKNWNNTLSIPVFTVCGHIACNYSFPMPTYKTVKDSQPTGAEWNKIFSNASTQYPWKSKVRKLVWRGALTGDLRNYTSPRARIARFAYENRNESMLDIGLSSIPPRHASNEETLLEIRSSLVNPISPMDNFQKYVAILDIDGNSWSSRFGTLLCYNSVILKVEPDHVDYFYLKYLKPWQHFIPVKSDLSDLLDMAKYVVDPANDERVRQIVFNANEWCKKRMIHSSLTEDMLDIWESYVGHLDASDSNWQKEWADAKRSIFSKSSPSAKFDDSFVMKKLLSMKVAMKG